MRKTILHLLALGLLLGGIFQNAQAQDKTPEFNLHAGALAEPPFRDVLFAFGAGLDFHLGKHLMISPELQLWKASDVMGLTSGATLNLRDKNFFVGGGVVILLLSVLGDENLDMSFIMPKINFGFRIKKIKITFYLLSYFDGFLPSFERIHFGGSIGIVG